MSRVPYSIVSQGDQYLAKVSDPPQLMNCQELWDWMVEVRDEDSDLCHEIVQIYFKLRKAVAIRNEKCVR